MEEKFNRMMPKNKTGIYASEIRNMLVPNPSETFSISKISVSNQSIDIGFRKHSAFKISVKPRQALASVNTKLMEQQRPNTKASSSHEYIPDDDPDRSQHEYSENYSESTINCNYGFRPSTVLKRHKLADDRGLASSRTSSSKTINLYNRNRKSDIYPELKKSSSPSLVNKRETKISKSDSPMSHRQKTLINLDEYNDDIKLKETTESELPSPKTRTDISSFSNTNNIYRAKTKIDLFKEIYEELQNKSNTKYDFRSNRNKQASYDNFNREEDFDLFVKNLNEEEFVNFLKEYRRTKSLDFNSIFNKDKNRSNGSNFNSKYTKIINLKGEFERSSTLNNFYTHSNPRLTNLSNRNDQSTSSFNSNKNEKDHILNRIPDFYLNYLNNRILFRTTTRNYSGLVPNKNSDINNAQYMKEIVNNPDNNKPNQDISQITTQSSIQADDQNDNQKFQSLKILNIPTTAN